MSDALDILTGGLTQATGLSVTTRGLLLEIMPGSVLGVAATALDARLIADAALILQDGATFEADLSVEAGQVVVDHGLLTAATISLFSDRLAESDDRLPADDGDRRGWWGDAYPPVPGDRIGSRLWLLHREKQTQETLNRAEEYAREAFDWMIEDGIASKVDVAASWIRMGVMGLEIGIERPTDAALLMRWAVAWEAL